MGASGWSYFVPYRADVREALQELRTKVFHAGEYYKPAEWYRLLHDRRVIDDFQLRELLKKLDPEPKPSTMEELIELRMEEGTHSIIDITEVSETGGENTISALTPSEYANILGTEKPEHLLVAQKASELQTLRGRWQGVYVVIYKDGLPEEIFFTGYSGD